MDRIYIPTFRRVDEQKTFERLPDKYKEKVIMVVQKDERPQYKYDVEYLEVGNLIGIAATRNEIYNHAGDTKFMMVDDDIVFHRRNKKYYGEEPNMEGSKRDCTEQDMDELFEMFNTWMEDGIIHMGCRPSWLPPAPVKTQDFCEIAGVHVINGKVFSKWKDEVDWNFVKVAEDSMLNLECLMRGYVNRRTDEFPAEMGMWQGGGCSEFRDAKVHHDENMKLATHPRYKDFVYMKKDVEVKHLGMISHFKFKYKEAYDSSKYQNGLNKFIN